MAVNILKDMASDLGINQFEKESQFQFKIRVIYSAVACWIKTITLDRSTGSDNNANWGISRRHLYDRIHEVFEAIKGVFPDIEEWFTCQNPNEHPTEIIRERLINHGDLLNAGFETNIALSSSRNELVLPELEVVYGKTLESNIQYVGISTVRKSTDTTVIDSLTSITGWFNDFVKEAWWSSALPDMSILQYFNPKCHSRNNYSAWQDSQINNDIVLSRTTINENGYEYYLFKNNYTLCHKLDPFLQSLGYHIKIMYALRSTSANRIKAIVHHYKDHIVLKLNAYLPVKEMSLLESYAWPLNSINDKLNWIIINSIWEYLEKFLTAIDIDLVEG